MSWASSSSLALHGQGARHRKLLGRCEPKVVHIHELGDELVGLVEKRDLVDAVWDADAMRDATAHDIGRELVKLKAWAKSSGRSLLLSKMKVPPSVLRRAGLGKSMKSL